MNQNLMIYLRDSDPNIGDALSSAFNGISSVHVSTGDIFDITADAIVSPANSFGYMDGAIDLVYSHFFGWGLQTKLQKIIQDKHYGELIVGNAEIVATGHTKIPYLISAPTMRVPCDVSTTINAYLAFRAALIAVLNFNYQHLSGIKSILCPGLGTGVGGISPFDCAKQIRTAYDVILGDARGFFPKKFRDCLI